MYEKSYVESDEFKFFLPLAVFIAGLITLVIGSSIWKYHAFVSVPLNVWISFALNSAGFIGLAISCLYSVIFVNREEKQS